ncbi:unnamed protein product [Urochloa decumbens]|uniref:F-box domain-containing protein n=1 Tax=Urochloa decumbens TaxID=240449 RepID=A0ABC8XMN8_9POAL
MATYALKPWLVQFGAGLEVQSFVSPFDDGSSYEAEIPAAQGKRCLGWHGEWLLMRDDATAGCFLLHLASHRTVHLPPLPDPPGPGESSALALASETAPPDCTVVLSVHESRWLLHCRPGDTEWGRLSEFEGDDGVDFLDGAAIAQGRRVYVTTMGGVVAVLDATPSSPVPRVESSGATTLPPTCPTHMRTTTHLLLESQGDIIFCVRLYLQPHGRQRRVVDVDIHVKRRAEDTWESVDTIGGRAVFIGGRNSCLVSDAARAKLQPNCIHVLGMPRDGGIPLYTIVLDDMSIRCKLVQGSFDAGGDEAYWAVPICFEQEEPSKDTTSCEVSGAKLGEKQGDQNASSTSLWSSLPRDLLELIVQEVTFMDSLRLPAVCKGWSGLTRSTSTPIHDAKSPLLLTTRSRTQCRFATFNPMTGKMYDLGIYISSGDPEPQVLRCSKRGWVLVTEGDGCVSVMNPLKGLIVYLPPMDNDFFSGITFVSEAGSPDFMVVCVSDWRGLGTTTVRTWRNDDEDWTVTEFEYDVPFLFPTASHNPVLFEGEFYCLGTDGRLGVFNPNKMTWRVLAKPEPLYDENTMEQNEQRYLVVWKGQLVAIFTVPHGGPMRTFRLDRSQMAWSELEDLSDAVLFFDSRDALARPAIRDDLGNRIYVQSFAETNDGASNAVFYSVKIRQYCPAFYGNIEPVNAIWFEPNLQDL